MYIAVCDTSTIIKLYKGGVLNYLKNIFEKVFIPCGVKIECDDYFDKYLINILNKTPFFIKSVKDIRSIGMGLGEREMISLALEMQINIVLTNDIQAIKKAIRFNLTPMTAENLLIAFKEIGLITTVREIMDKMQLKEEGIAKNVYIETLKLAGEFT